MKCLSVYSLVPSTRPTLYWAYSSVCVSCVTCCRSYGEEESDTDPAPIKNRTHRGRTLERERDKQVGYYEKGKEQA